MKKLLTFFVLMLAIVSMQGQVLAKTETKKAAVMEEITNHAVAKSPSLAPNQKSTVFTEGFEGATAPALPAGWTQVGTWRTSTGLTGTPPISAHTGQLGLLAHWDQTTFTGWCFSPDFPLVSGTTYTISFYFMAPGYQNEPDNLIAYIGQNRTAAIATTGTKIFEQITSAGTNVRDWALVTYSFTPTTTGNFNLAFNAPTTGTGLGNFVFIDDISIVVESTEPGEIADPYDLAVNVSGTTATFTWKHEDADVPGGDDDTPWFEGFEGTTGGGYGDGQTQPASTMPTGWTRTHDDVWGTTNNNVFGVDGSTQGVPANIPPRTGTRQMVRSWAQTGSFAWAFSGGIQLTAGVTYTIEFWYMAPGYPQYNEFDLFKVQIAPTTDRTGSGANAQMTGGTTILTNGDTRITEWTLCSYNFTPTSSGLYYLGFHDMTPQEQGLYVVIDDISIEAQAKTASKDLVSFDVYLNDDFVANVSATTLQYVFADLDNGDYTAGVQAIGTGGIFSDIVSKAFTVSAGNVVKPLEVNNFTIYPNPVEEILFINATESVKRIEIYNVEGKLMKVVTNNTGNIQVNDLRSGAYMIKITTDKGTATQRFVKK